MVTQCSANFSCSNRVVLRYFFIRLSAACLLLTTVSTAQPPSDVLLTTVLTSQPPSDVLLTTVSTAQHPSDVLLTTVSTSQPPSDVLLTTMSTSQPPSDVLLTTVSKVQPPSDVLLTTVSTAQTPSDVLLTTVSKAQPPSDVLLTTVSTTQTPSDVLLTTVSTAETPSDVLMRQIMDDIYKVAPHNRFCNRTEPKIEKSFNPDYGEYSCTIPCSCDPSTCWDKLPCCPDIHEPMPESRRNSSCLYPVISSKPYNIFNHPQHHADFPIRMVHDCEQQHIASELHRKCLIFRNTSDVEHLVPVVSNSTGIIYANRFCAECSGITNYQTFTTEFICWNSLLFPRNWELLALDWSTENRIKLIEAGMCNYVFNTPNVDELENNRCMQIRYTACNETGEWDVYDPVLEDACGAYELPYNDNFRNFHCMLCNTPSWYSLPENRYSWYPTCYFFKTSILEISFYSLISLDHKQLTGKSSPYLNKVDQACRNMPHAVYDKYTVSIVRFWPQTDQRLEYST